METWTMVGCAAAGFLICWSLIPILQRWPAREKGQRNFHHEPSSSVSRLGGVAIAVAFVVVILGAAAVHSFRPFQQLHQLGVMFGSLAMFAVGLWDDFKPLGAKLKLLAQVCIASAVYLS